MVRVAREDPALCGTRCGESTTLTPGAGFIRRWSWTWQSEVDVVVRNNYHR